VITGPLFDRLLAELAAAGIRFEIIGGALDRQRGPARE
jgi:hypothetical protein